MYNTASELYNDLLETHFDEYYYLLDAKSSKMDPTTILMIKLLINLTIVNSTKKNQVMKKS